MGDRTSSRRERSLVDLEFRPERLGRRIRRKHEQRRAALGSLRQAGERIREAWTLMNAHDADLPTGARVAVGHHDCAALVAGGVERRAGRMQRVSDGEVATTDEPKNTSTPRSANDRPIALDTRIVHYLSRRLFLEQYYCMSLYSCLPMTAGARGGASEAFWRLSNRSRTQVTITAGVSVPYLINVRSV